MAGLGPGLPGPPEGREGRTRRGGVTGAVGEALPPLEWAPRPLWGLSSSAPCPAAGTSSTFLGDCWPLGYLLPGNVPQTLQLRVNEVIRLSVVKL